MKRDPTTGSQEIRPIAVIMAGGKGERFWPLSRRKNPKQFLRLGGTLTLLEETVMRITPEIPMERVIVVTGAEHSETVYSLLPELPRENVIAEPAARDTAACAGLAATIVARSFSDDPPIFMMPSDHLVRDRKAFLDTMNKAAAIALETMGLVTIGIKPDRPHTGFGYIKPGEPLNQDGFKVERFVEKPDLQTAQGFLEEGSYLWNSGIFCWRPSAIIEEIEKHMPDLAECLETPMEDPRWKERYSRLVPLSVDYGIMEKASRVYVVKGGFGWDDVGTWESFARHSTGMAGGDFEVSRELEPSQNNLVMEQGDSRAVLLDCSGCMVLPSRRLVAGLGLQDLVIVDTEDAVLVLKRDSEQKVKELLSQLRLQGLAGYL